MPTTLPFGGVLDVIETLSLDEQETLLDIMQKRLVERGRQQRLADIQEAREEYAQGACQPTSVEALMQEILS